MKSGRGMPPLLTTRSWILRSIWRMLSTSQRTLSQSRSTWRAAKRICISSAEIFFCSSRYFGALWPSFCSTPSMRVYRRRITPKRVERGDLEALEVLGGDRAAVVLGFLAFLDFLVVHRLELLVEIHQAVDDVVDLQLVALDLGGELEDLRDRHRTGRDRHDHVLEAFFDPLGDLDFAFAGQSSTEPISRMYMRTGSVVRPNSESSVDAAASAASSSTSSAAAVGAASDISSCSASGASS